jgi:hypothetical protein
MEASHLNDPKPLDTLLLRLSVAVAMELPAHLATTYRLFVTLILVANRISEPRHHIEGTIPR